MSRRGNESLRSGEMAEEEEPGKALAVAACGSEQSLPALENPVCMFVFSNSCHSVL